MESSARATEHVRRVAAGRRACDAAIPTQGVAGGGSQKGVPATFRGQEVRIRAPYPKQTTG